MNITELKELAEKATPGPWVAGDDEDSDYFLVGPCGYDGIVYQSVVKLHSEINADYIAAANPAEILELIAQLEDAQGEIRALRATEAGLVERVKALEEGLQSLASYPLEEFALESKPDNRQLFGANDWKLSVGNVKRASALLEKKE